MVNRITWRSVIFSNRKTAKFFYAYNSKREELGFIGYHPPWRKWVWTQNKSIIMNSKCLKEIAKKMEIIQ